MQLTAEQKAIRETVREFAVEEIRPVADETDRTQTFPEDIWDELAALDLTGLTVPERYGGFDADTLTYALVNEEVAYGLLSVATALSVHCLATSCIREFGNRELQSEWLPEMVDGRPVGAFALSEPQAGSNPAAMTTVARREGDEYVIDGKKQWITNGERSGVVVLFARTDRDDPDSITQFLVPTERDGVEVGKKEDKLGLRASDTTTLLFDGARIPAEYRLTAEGRGLAAALSILTGGRIGIAAQSVGLAQAALDEALAYAQEREQFDQPISEFQAIQHKLAEMETTVQASRLLTWDAARRADADAGAGTDADPETDTDVEAEADTDANTNGTQHKNDTDSTVRMAASMAKYFASEGAVDVTQEAVQIHGGYGYTKEYDVEQFYRDAKITTIYEGTTEIQKQIIADELL